MTAAIGYLRRDYLIWSSYRVAAFWQLSSVFLLAAIVYYAGNAIGDNSSFIDQENGSYVAFLLVGVAVMDLLSQAMGSLPAQISESQRAGTFEPVLLTPVSSTTLLMSFWVFRFSMALVRALILLGFGALFLGFWHSANVITVFAVLIPASLTFLGIGALSGAFVVLLKQGDPVRLAYSGAMAVLGGVIFPIGSLPSWLEPLALLLPITHTLNGVRDGLDGASPADVLGEIVILITMAALLLPAGIRAFDAALRRAKREGSLGEY